MFQPADSIFKKIRVTERLYLDGIIIMEGDHNITDASAISITTPVTWVTTAGAETRTLADGVYEGQMKVINCLVYVGDAVITPANLAGGTTITLNAAGDQWTGVWLAGEWHTQQLLGTAAVA